jgi:hypothetical protein
MMREAEINLNIPQSFNRKYTSPMRIYSGFWNGRPTISLNTFHQSEIDQSIKHFLWHNSEYFPSNLKEHIKQRRVLQDILF